MGSGKTTILGEASDLLVEAGIAHAAIDLDALGVWFLPRDEADDLVMRNLAAVAANYEAAGIDRLLVAEAIVDRERLQSALPGARIVVCRLRAPIETMQERVRLREPSMLQEKFVARVAELERALDAAGVEDFALVNDGSVTDVAREMLSRAGWL